MHDINFEQYKVFYYVAKNLSFSLAAKELFISQSAVSQSIKNLENRIGVSLFLRQAKKISLTSEGQILFDSVKIAFSHITNGEHSIMSNSETQKKELKIAASDTISKYFLLSHIETFNTLHPEVKLKISNKPSNQCFEMLKNSEVDIAVITYNESLLDPNYSVSKLRKMQDVFIAGSKFSYLKGKKLSLEDIKDLPILTLGQTASTRIHFDELIKMHNLSVQPEIETQSIGLLKDLARIGLGISYITDLAITKDSDLFVLDIKEPLATNFVSVATVKRQKRSKFVEEFLNLISN
ncbi:MAG: LysR family transcriptional regulator [Clostridia bacterium]